MKWKNHQFNVIVRDCTGGKAEDMGDTWFWPLASSGVVVVLLTGGPLELGVAGVFPGGITLPMNHDCRRSQQPSK